MIRLHALAYATILLSISIWITPEYEGAIPFEGEASRVLFNYFNNVSDPRIFRTYAGYVSFYPNIIGYLSKFLPYTLQYITYLFLPLFIVLFFFYQVVQFLRCISPIALTTTPILIAIAMSQIMFLAYENLIWSIWPAFIASILWTTRIFLFNKKYSIFSLIFVLISFISHPVSICIAPIVFILFIRNYISNREKFIFTTAFILISVALSVSFVNPTGISKKIFEIPQNLSIILNSLVSYPDIISNIDKYPQTYMGIHIFILSLFIFTINFGNRIYYKNCSDFKFSDEFLARASLIIISLVFCFIFSLSDRVQIYSGKISSQYSIIPLLSGLIYLSTTQIYLRNIGNLFNFFREIFDKKVIVISTIVLIGLVSYTQIQKTSATYNFLTKAEHCLLPKGELKFASFNGSKYAPIIMSEATAEHDVAKLLLDPPQREARDECQTIVQEDIDASIHIGAPPQRWVKIWSYF